VTSNDLYDVVGFVNATRVRHINEISGYKLPTVEDLSLSVNMYVVGIGHQGAALQLSEEAPNSAARILGQCDAISSSRSW
jgi:hypothetical protein